MTTVRQEAVDLLRSLGQRVTAPRVAVLEAMLELGDEHLTAELVHARVARDHDGSAAHRTTVYRTLDALTQAGVLRHVHLAIGDRGVTAYHIVRTRERHHGHLHAQCSTCHRVVDLPEDVLGDLAARVRGASGFELDAGHVAFAGRCADCSTGHDLN